MVRCRHACSIAPKRMKYFIEYVGPLNTEEPTPPNPASPDIDWNNIREEDIDEIVSRLATLKEQLTDTHLWALPTPKAPPRELTPYKNAPIKKGTVENKKDGSGLYKNSPTSTAT